MSSSDPKHTFDARLLETVSRLTDDACHTIPDYVLDQVEKTDVDQLDLDPDTAVTRSPHVSRAQARVYVRSDIYYVSCQIKSRTLRSFRTVVFAVKGSANFADFMTVLEKEIVELVE